MLSKNFYLNLKCFNNDFAYLTDSGNARIKLLKKNRNIDNISIIKYKNNKNHF